MSIIKETLKNPEGKWSRKSVTSFVAFTFALGYEVVLPYFGIETKEYVFITLIGLTATVLGLTVWDKK
jgi:hypothetical protein